ncbi:hypothetical protein Pelo_12362 [Pelomyxa schiedti]|nr:hypothetical protein Pelo_12917 [Pelomyxa schiedti]KAH3746223.1 hypothetical protein Pelo_12362 [Pelomyxa schiedti]
MTITCTGGHIDMAQELVQSGGRNEEGWRGVPLSWPVGDMLDDIRDATAITTASLLWDACRGGHVDAVKWVISTFDVGREGWELVGPFHSAVAQGNVDVVKWLASSTCVLAACRIAMNIDPWSLEDFFGTPSLEIVKLCAEWFCGKEKDPGDGVDILSSFIRCSSRDESDVEEGCQWIKESFSVTSLPKLNINKEKAFKWVVQNFTVPLTENDLSYALRNSKSLELLLWLPTLLTSDGFGPCTPDIFISACGNRHDNVSVLNTLLPITVPPLTTEQLHRCLQDSLDHSNTSIADWLEKTFHVMDSVNADPCVANSIFPKINSFNGLEWFLSKIAPHILSEIAVCEAVENNLQFTELNAVLLLLDKLNFSIPPSVRPLAVEQAVCCANVSKLMQLLSHGNFSSEDVAEGLTNHVHVKSGKVVKYLINRFHLNVEQVKACENTLLLELLYGQKTNCAEWLIRKFHITLDEICSVVKRFPWFHPENSMSLSTWKMLLRVFPDITAEFLKEHLMKFAMASPLHIQVTVRTVEGLTMADMVPDTPHEGTRWLTSLWLEMQL